MKLYYAILVQGEACDTLYLQTPQKHILPPSYTLPQAQSLLTTPI